jgi:hydrogenase maturation protease
MNQPKVLLIGYGNPGRLDDGLGPALAEQIDNLALPGVTVDSDYQLTVEHAHDVAEYDVVIFADAHVSCTEPFEVRRIEPTGATVSFSSHSVSPDGVIALAAELFSATPAAYTLGIRGYEFNEFGYGLSDRAEENLRQAVAFVTRSAAADLAGALQQADQHRPDK